VLHLIHPNEGAAAGRIGVIDSEGLETTAGSMRRRMKFASCMNAASNRIRRDGAATSSVGGLRLSAVSDVRGPISRGSFLVQRAGISGIGIMIIGIIQSLQLARTPLQ